MNVTLKGSSARALTNGILLLSRARTFGQRIAVDIVGDPEDLAEVVGPALVYAPVLASCGVGRDLGSGSLLVMPGPPIQPLAVSLHASGLEDWFLVDRKGEGEHPATRAFVALCRDGRDAARHLGRQLRRAIEALGCPPEPALMDLLFSSPVPPLQRIALMLRGGRAMTGSSGMPLTRFLVDRNPEDVNPLPSPCTLADWKQAQADGNIAAALDRVSLGVRDATESWLEGMDRLTTNTEDEYAVLLCALTEVVADLLTLPVNSMLPPLDPAGDAIAVHIGPALGATRGQSDAIQVLSEVFRFLGGKFVPEAPYAVNVGGSLPPNDRLQRWQWLCEGAHAGAEMVEGMWRDLMEPVQ